MGVVYKAYDTKLKRPVALKFLSRHLLTDEQQRKRFIHEAQAAAGLTHPHICTIYEIHEADGHTFMVMECIEGESLRQKIESGALEVGEALDVAIQVAKGLSRAHGQGIVHRDIKPGNVLMTPEGDAKIVDFGLAKLTAQTRLTKTGATVGTVMYMSPEQATGDGVDHRTDIWSWGAMLYEMLTGKLPFRGEVEHAVVYSIMNEDPEPITTTRKDVPVAVEEIVERALAKDPEKRYATVDEFLAALEEQRDRLALGIKERRFVGLRRLRRRKRVAYGTSAVVVVLTAVLVSQLYYSRSMAVDSIVVLPVENLSGDPDEEYFADGMTETLITALAKIRGLKKVISRTSAMKYKETEKTIPEIAGELGVDAVLEASVTRSGDRVRITANLIHARTDRHLWSENYEYEAYLKGRYWYNQAQSSEELDKSLEYFQRAVEIDSTCAVAYAGMAEYYFQLSHGSILTHHEAAPKVKAAVNKALQLDETLAEARTARAHIMWEYDWDFRAAEDEFKRAIELNPSYGFGYMLYAFYCETMGRFDEAAAHITRALELDPLSRFINTVAYEPFLLAGRHEEAIEQIQKTHEMFPDYEPGNHLRQVYLYQGLYKKALQEHEKVMPADPDVWYLAYLAFLQATVGRESEARQFLDDLKDRSEQESLDPLTFSALYAYLGDNDRALDCLEKAYEQRNLWLLRIGFWPAFDPLRDDPRFKELLVRIGLPG
jgi:serine/threonine-protein kinase